MAEEELIKFDSAYINSTAGTKVRIESGEYDNWTDTLISFFCEVVELNGMKDVMNKYKITVENCEVNK